MIGTFENPAEIGITLGSVKRPAANIVVSSALYPNKPAGLSDIVQIDGTTKDVVGTSAFTETWDDWDGVVSVEADATNPLGTGFVLRWDHAIGFGGGGNARFTQNPGGAVDTWYMMYRVFYPSGYPNEHGRKNFYWGENRLNRGPSSTGTAFYMTREADLRMDVTNQVIIPSVDMFSAAGAFSPQGEWKNVEMLCIAESTAGAGDGTLQVWINNSLIFENFAAEWVNAGDATGFDGFEWYNTYSTSDTVASYYRIGELYIAGA